MSKPSFVYVTYIATTIERLYQALTSAEFTERYMFGRRVESTWAVGAPVRYVGRDGGVSDSGEVLESDPPRMLRHTWRALYDPETATEPFSRVTWEIEPQEGGVTKLTVVHDQLEGAPKTAESVAGGWMYILSGLKTLLETGKPLQG